MSPETAQLELTPVSLDDLEHYAEWEKGLGWDTDFTQLTPGPNPIGYDHFALPQVLVSHFTREQATKELFWIPDGLVFFSIARAKRPFVWSGREYPPTLLFVGRAGRESWIVTPGGWDSYLFLISEEWVRQTEIIDPTFFEGTGQLERAFLPLVEPLTGRFIEGLDGFFQTARGTNGSPGSPIPRDLFIDFVLDGLQQVFDAGLQARGSLAPRRLRRADLVAQGRDFALAHQRENVSAEDMAQALGVSYRVLNYAFKDSLGVSPYQFLLALRLRAVRQQLLTSGGSVTDVSFKHGFFAASKFTRRYSHFFGERPSETKRRARRRD